MRIINAQPGAVLHLGRAGEDYAVEIHFNLIGWVPNEADSGNIALYYSANSNALTEVASGVISHTNPTFIWTIAQDITSITGNGKVQLVFTPSSDTGAKAISTWYDTVVTSSLYTEFEEPGDISDWVDRLTEAVNNASTIVDAEQKIIKSTASAHSVSYKDQPTATITEVVSADRHMNFDFGIPQGQPFRIEGTYGTVEQVYQV